MSGTYLDQLPAADALTGTEPVHIMQNGRDRQATVDAIAARFASSPAGVEAVQDIVAAFLAQGSNITLAYDDVANTLTISSPGGGIADAPAAPPGVHYVRQNGAWVDADARYVLDRRRPRGVRLRRSGNISIANNTATMLPFDIEDFDDYGSFNSGVSTTRINAPSWATWCRVTGRIEFATGTTGNRIVRVEKNSAGVPTPANIVAQDGLPASIGAGAVLHEVFAINGAGGDYIEIVVFHSQGSALNVIPANGLRTTHVLVEWFQN
ncbi:hypothetical protein [Microcystis phage Mae-Yong1326-1]|nr:hypothetical protein [Microcystis phage Mae-Yong1326-1]